MSYWTDEATELLKSLWETHSARTIAGQLEAKGYGSFTRNAVVGRAHRLGLTYRDKRRTHPQTIFEYRAPRARVSTAHRVGGDASKILHAIKRQQKERAKIGAPKISPEPFVCRAAPDIEPRDISLADLGHDDCRWPFGEGPFTFCGHPKAIGSSYCPAHQILARGEGTPAERAAHRIPKEAAA